MYVTKTLAVVGRQGFWTLSLFPEIFTSSQERNTWECTILGDRLSARCQFNFQDECRIHSLKYYNTSNKARLELLLPNLDNKSTNHTFTKVGNFQFSAKTSLGWLVIMVIFFSSSLWYSSLEAAISNIFLYWQWIKWLCCEANCPLTLQFPSAPQSFIASFKSLLLL